MTHYQSAGQRCPRCKRSFRVLEDEQGMHACPSCGYGPEDDEPEDDPEDDDDDDDEGPEGPKTSQRTL